jgi:hypothetical protein
LPFDTVCALGFRLDAASAAEERARSSTTFTSL